MSNHYAHVLAARRTHTSGANYLGIMSTIAQERAAAATQGAAHAEALRLAEAALWTGCYASVASATLLPDGTPMPYRTECFRAKQVTVTRIHARTPNHPRKWSINFVYQAI